jgi:hypothetical protein
MRFLRPGSVEVVHIRVEHAVELLLMQDEQMIEALTPYTAEEPLTNGIRARGVIRSSSSAHVVELCSPVAYISEWCVFCHEFGLACRKVSQRSQEKSGVGWFGPVDETVVERLKAKACQSLDEGENPLHSVRSPFVKMSR